ncbi:hypothetical protein [Acetivibrio sp. MSJd-27]|uniref:hypothetical protein n=1 Tax=Acetivibrio sp. MSJd-27 TaxID=2841523 RepID=UPI001C0F54DA|nr:hypothetical protein [Acetivibrio sp. MSJd-27]MBU5449489.1 hypothetical protein [Acetivibrio sp. MSJd-27]
MRDNADSCKKYAAKNNANSKGQFGIQFKGNLSLLGDSYYIRAYVTYTDRTELHTIYSDKIIAVNN